MTYFDYPNDLDGPLNETVTDKISEYHTDYNNRSSNTISFMSVITSTSGRLTVNLCPFFFLETHRETDRFFTSSGVAKATYLRIDFNIDGEPIVSRSHTHPSYSQTSRFLTWSQSLGVPVPHTTQCM